MAIITYNNVGIAAMAAAVPKNVIANYHYDLDIWPEEEVKKVVDKVGRYGKPEDIAFAAIYLLSDAVSWVTGHSLFIDGVVTI